MDKLFGRVHFHIIQSFNYYYCRNTDQCNFDENWSLTLVGFFFSAHGTFMGQILLEPHKPQQVPFDSTSSSESGELKAGEAEKLTCLLGLPEEETELDMRDNLNLTEFNTTHNKHISTCGGQSGQANDKFTYPLVITKNDICPACVTADVAAVRRMHSLPGKFVWGPSSHQESRGDPALHSSWGGATILSGFPLLLPNFLSDVDVTPTSAEPSVTLNYKPAPRPYSYLL
uniref:Uncharacterized protein n=1 Tax=Mastacembelus armatus TaxID=205130 RepID=A0A3Q3KNC7_9TELE